MQNRFAHVSLNRIDALLKDFAGDIIEIGLFVCLFVDYKTLTKFKGSLLALHADNLTSIEASTSKKDDSNVTVAKPARRVAGFFFFFWDFILFKTCVLRLSFI